MSAGLLHFADPLAGCPPLRGRSSHVHTVFGSINPDDVRQVGADIQELVEKGDKLIDQTESIQSQGAHLDRMIG